MHKELELMGIKYLSHSLARISGAIIYVLLFKVLIHYLGIAV